MAVTVDAKCVADTEINSVVGTTGITSTNLTIGASATALFAVLVFDGSVTLTSPAMTWNSVAMTQIGTTLTSAGNGQIMLFGLVSPATGAKTLKATWVGTGVGYMASMSFIGTVTSSVASCFTNFNSATPTGTGSTAFNITGASGNYAIAANGNDNATYTTFIHATSSTLLFSDTNNNYAACAYAPEVGTTTAFTWAQTASQINVVAGCTVVAAASGTNANATGVAGTGAAGTLVANVEPGSAGVTGTGSAGTVVANVKPGPAGVTGTGGAGTLSGQTGVTFIGVIGTGQVGTPVASIGGNISGAAGTGQVGVLQSVQGQNAVISGVGGTGQAGTLADEIDAGGLTGAAGTGQVGVLQGVQGQNAVISGVGGTGQAGTLTTSSVNNLVAAPIQGGPGGDEGAGEEARRKWLEWSRKKRQKEKAKLATPIVAKAIPVTHALISAATSLLERNLHAQRMQIMQQAIAEEAARQQEEDDEEAIALLLDA